MEQVNALCEVENCGKKAKAFGMKGTQKTRCCQEHIPSLLGKGMQIHDIAGYQFISSSQDIVEFEERKTQVEKGCGNLAVLEASCEYELVAALQTIETAKNAVVKSVNWRFEEMKVVVTEVCNEAMKQLSQLRLNYEEFISSKDNRLLPIAELLCLSLRVTPKFLRFGIADVSDSVSEVLSESWTVATADIHSTLKCLDATQRSAAVDSALAEAAACAQRGIPEALQHVDSLIEGEVSLEGGVSKVLIGILEFEKKKTERRLKWLRRFWDLRQQYEFSDQSTIDSGKNLAVLLYCRLGQFAEAEEILRYCFDVSQNQNPLSEDSMSLCNEILGVYFASGRYTEIDQLGRWILDTFEPVNLPAEHYWTTLFYLTFSKRETSQKNEATAILETWEKRGLREGNKLAEVLRLLTCGIEAYYSDAPQKAVELLRQAGLVGLVHFPTSPFTAVALFHLALLCEGDTREQYNQQAQSIYEVAAPKSIQAAYNLSALGNIYKTAKRWSESEASYRQAQSILKVTGQKSPFSASILTSLGGLYKEAKRLSEAEECYREAQHTLESVAPQSTIAVKNFSDLGNLLSLAKRWSEAEWCYRQAQFTLETTGQRSNFAAKNLNDLGLLFKTTKKWSEAEDCYRQAQSILEVADPNSILAANNLCDLGNLFKATKRLSEARECYRKAQSIYQVVDPKSIIAAGNLCNLGILYMDGKRLKDAEKCYQCAQSIYEVAAPRSVDAAYNYYNMGQLYEAMKQAAQAVECYEKSVSIYTENGDASWKSRVQQHLASCQKARGRS